MVFSVATVAAKNSDVSIPLHLVQTEVNGCFMHKKCGMVQRPATGKRQKVQLIISIIANMKKMPGKSKKTKRSIALSKRSQLEAIRVD